MTTTLIIDEYQDFNPLEQEILDILIDNIGQTYLLGDDDQCIYDFKDSSSDRIIEIYNDTNNRKIEHEHKCYRCADKIVEHATNLILENQKRVPKKWEKSGKIGGITYLQLNTIDEVADSIVNTLKTLDNSKKILLLTPVKNIIDPIIRKFEFNNIQFTNCFRDKTPEHILQKAWEVRLLFGNFKYLNLILFGYNALTNRKKFYQCLKRGYDSGENYEQLFDLLKKTLPDFLLNISSLDDLLSQERYQDIFELYQSTEGRSSEDKLEKMLNASVEQEESNIQIMSIHKSKGLQAEYVFMVGLNEGIIPNITKGNDSIEYQRRLFYVGMTRAKTNLFLFSNIYTEGKYVFTIDKSKFRYEPRNKLWRGRASTFISDLKLN